MSEKIRHLKYPTASAGPPRQPESEFQRMVGEWADDTFPGATLVSIATHLQEEADELLEAALGATVVRSYDTVNTVARELADVVLLCLHLAHRVGIDLVTAGASRHQYNRTSAFETTDTGRGYLKRITPDAYTPGHLSPDDGVRFVDFLVAMQARMSVDITDPDFREHSDTPEALAQYLLEFVWPTFLDRDQAFPGQSEIALIGTPVVVQRLAQRTP